MSTVVESSTSFTISTVPGGEALGVENWNIPDENITASSSAGPAPPHLARLNGPFSWCAGKAEDCFLQIDLGSLHLVCAVATQGNPGGNRDYVRRYKLQCSTDGVNWTVYEENGNSIIAGNTDNWSVKRKDLEHEVVTRFVKFCPVDWYCWPCLRVELYGAPLNINEKLADLQSEDGGGFVLEKVLVTTYETTEHEIGDSGQNEESLEGKETVTSELIIEDVKRESGYHYPVHIYTGDKWGAGTDANVLITIFGEQGDSGEKKLDNNKNNFERGQKDSFSISCETYLGRLTKIRIGHDNSGFGAAWFLDKVTVEDPNTGKEVIFSCQRWFSSSDDDGRISRELVRDDKDEETIVSEAKSADLHSVEEVRTIEEKVMVTTYETTEHEVGDSGQNEESLEKRETVTSELVIENVKRESDYQYPVHIYTGDKWGAGTDANVLITIFGEEGGSGEKKLDNNKNNFESGQKDSFSISCETYLGRLTKIRIGHDNSGFGAAWFLDKVTVEDPNTREEVIFSCQRWFSSSDGDGQILRELVRDDKDEETIVSEVNESEKVADLQSVDEVRAIEEYKYSVDIYTGDKWGAGTDANILITIFGENGDSGEKKLDNSRNNFERGQKDSVTISSDEYLGRLTKIRIGHNNTGFAAAWYLDKVTVADDRSGETVTFSCQRWFSTSEDDGLITREITRDDKEKVDNNGGPDLGEGSLKEEEKNRTIGDAEEKQRKEAEENKLDEIEFVIEKQEIRRKQSVGDDQEMDIERIKALASIELRREKPDGQADEPTKHTEKEVEENINPSVKEYSRIEEEHRQRIQEIERILGEDEERRKREKDERRKDEEDARRQKEEERRKRDEEMKKKREEERLKWEEEHKKWEEERKKRDLELQAVLEEGRRKREEERRKRDEELKKTREEERKKREEERKKRMEEEMRKLEELKREREERWKRRNSAGTVEVDITLQATKGEEDKKNRLEEKKRKEDDWKKTVEVPRMVEEDMKRFRDEERKRLEEERKKRKEKELADAEAEKELKSELRMRKQGEEPQRPTHISVATIRMEPARDVTIAEEKRRVEWRMEKIEQDRKIREEEEKKRREESERKRKEEEQRVEEEQERKQKEEGAERERRREELRLKREVEEKQRREEEQRKREQEEIRRKTSLEEKRKRLDEERKRREMEELMWRQEMEEKKKRDEEEKRKQMESKRNKRMSIERKKFDEDEKKRLDAIERKRIEEEERVRIEEEQQKREERERWKLRQLERRRSGQIYRRMSEEDLRNRENRASFKDTQRLKRNSQSFENKWMFINGERMEVPANASLSPTMIEISCSEPVIFPHESPETKNKSVRTIETKNVQPEVPENKDYKDSSRASSAVCIVTTTTTTTRTRYSSSSCQSLPRSTSSQLSLSMNGDVRPYRSQPRCDHLLPADPAVQLAEEESFFDKFDREEEGKLRPFPSWYGSLDMGSLSHLYSPENPITDSNIDQLLAIEREDFSSWKRVKKSRELEIFSRKGKGRASPPVTKATIVLKDVPYRDAIDLVADWEERSKWDKTFDGVSFLDQMADFKVLKCSLEKKNRCFVLASLDREDEEPYYAWTWKAANHPSVPGDDTKVTVLRMETGICGAIIRPYHDATRSSKITIITQVRGSVPSPLKSTYLTGNPSKWLSWLKKHYESKAKNTAKKDDKDDSSSTSSDSGK
ncbi:uncharacterized protein [Montipora foliosa]|uniref:uncharacterized protein isoform X2 n=1 Tax=Montipora foliosa TaxID=591990 RepID=UPI0035F1E215